MNHLTQIASKLPEYGLDAMLITSDAGERYALGFHGEGLLLVTREGAHYTTDGRYIEAAQEQITGAQVSLVTTGSGHLAQARAYLEEHGLHNVGFESGLMTVDQHRRYAQELPCILTPAQPLLDDLRASKDEEELAAMRRAQQITDEAFKAILSFIRPGMTEREIAARLVYELLRRGGEKVSFDPIVAAGANGSRPHAVPGDQVVDTGMFITMDFGCKVDGYCSDMTRTVALGQPTEEAGRWTELPARSWPRRGTGSTSVTASATPWVWTSMSPPTPAPRRTGLCRPARSFPPSRASICPGSLACGLRTYSSCGRAAARISPVPPRI